MDWEFTKQKINCYEVFIDTAINREDTTEMIVPDLYPDILRVVDTSGIICTKNKEVKDGHAEIEGVVRAVILYVPENGQGLKKLDAYIPFRQTIEHGSFREDSKMRVRISIQSIETRVINPRKILVRTSVMICVTAYNPSEMEICGDIGGEEGNLQLLRNKENPYLPLCVKDKSFTLMDEIEIASTKPAAAEILKTDIRLTATDSRIIGNKVVLKGYAAIKTMYREKGYEESLIHTMENEMPFSQIIELEEADESADCEVEMILAGVEMDIRSDGGDSSRIIYVNLSMNAQIKVSMVKTLDTIADMYSTTYDIAVDSRTQSFTRLLDKGEKHITVREVLETGMQADSVVDVTVSMGPVKMERVEDGVKLISEALVSVLYISDDRELYSISRSIDVECPLDMELNADCTAIAVFAGEAFGAGLTSGVEVRFGVDFKYTVTAAAEMSMITGVRADMSSEKDSSGRPSLVLRHVIEGESIWSVAKRYNTTIDDIITANELGEDADDIVGKLLLIPRKR